MKTETHFEFANKICKTLLKTDSFAYQKSFIWGCIEPDFNPFSYLKGWKIRPFFGHNWENSKDYITQIAKKILSESQYNTENMFMLGRLIHYVCDAFTYTHNTAFFGTLHDHTEYEKQLHKVFFQRLKTPDIIRVNYANNLWESIYSMHKNYVSMPFSIERDIDYITAATSLVLRTCL